MVEKIDLTKLKDKEKRVAEEAVNTYRQGMGRIQDTLQARAADYQKMLGLPLTKNHHAQRLRLLEEILSLEKEIPIHDPSIR